MHYDSVGHNVQYYCERFGVCDIDVICSSKQWKLQADVDGHSGWYDS